MRRALSVITLAVLAPVVAELLAGTIPLQQIGNLLILLPIYGAGAVLIRELVRRRGRGWPSILLLGAAYGIIEEGLATQALFSPSLYGVAAWSPRFFGINLAYTELVIPLHAIWSAAIPILLAELLFPARRRESWLGWFGLGITGIFYLLGVALLAYGARTQLDPGYAASPVLLGLCVVAAVVLGVIALVLLPKDTPAPVRGPATPSPWLVLLVSGVGAFAFLALLHPLGSATQPVFTKGAVVFAPMVAALALAVALMGLVRSWSRTAGWGDRQLLALASGALIGHTLLFIPVHRTVAERLSLAGLGVGMVVVLALLAALVARRTRAAADSSSHLDASGLGALR